MSSFRVYFDVPEIEQAINAISVYDGKSRLAVENAVKNATLAIKAGAKQRVPVKSGKLKKQITSTFKTKSCTGFVRVKSPLAHLIEFGVKANVEKPKNKKALLIMGFRNANNKLLIKKANLPARAGKPFLKDSFDEEKPNLIRDLEKAVQP